MEVVISVITSVYNLEKYIAETIESVLSQTLQEFEFLIVDDGSSDKTAEIIRRYAALDSRIVPIIQENTGKCTALNLAVTRAKASWCAFLDADDIMLPQRLEKQMAFHKKNPEVIATSCHSFYINEKGERLGTQRYPFLQTIEDGKKALQNNEIIHCAFTGLMISKKCYEEVGGLRSPFWPCEDLEFANRIIEKGFNLINMQEVLMKYRIHPSSITSRKQWQMFEISDYTTQCIILRRSGQPEISFEEFKKSKESESWRKKIDNRRFRYSQILHKDAGFALYSKRYVRFLWKFMAASILAPNYVLATLRNRFNLNRIAVDKN